MIIFEYYQQNGGGGHCLFDPWLFMILASLATHDPVLRGEDQDSQDHQLPMLQWI